MRRLEVKRFNGSSWDSGVIAPRGFRKKMSKQLKKLLATICGLILGIAMVVTVIDARWVWEHTSAEITDKRVRYDEERNKTDYCVEIHVVEQNIEFYTWECGSAYDVDWFVVDVGDDIIYRETRWIFWWE